MPSSAELLAAYGTATLHEAMGRRGLMRGIELMVGPPFSGPARTVEIPSGDNLGLHEVLQHAASGEVLCIASGGNGAFGVLGDLLHEAARARRVAGLVIADGIRDLASLVPPPSIAAAGVSARGTVKRRTSSLDQPVAMGHLLVRPGDWVVADRDGVCVVPADHLAEVLTAAAARTEKETDIRERLRGGRTSVDVLGLGHLIKRKQE